MTDTQQPPIRDALIDTFIAAAPAEAARALEDYPAPIIAEVLASLSPEKAALVLGALSPSRPRAVLCAMEPGVAAQCAEKLSVPWVVVVARGCPELDSMIAALPAERRAAIKRASQQSVGLVASLVEPASLAFAIDVKAAQALESVRESSSRERGDVFVVDRAGHLVGVVDPVDLVGVLAATNLGDLMRPCVSVEEDSLLSELIGHHGWSQSRALPVVDQHMTLRGVVRFESMREAMFRSSGANRTAISVPATLAELFWLGLTGITDGLARSVTRTTEQVHAVREERNDER